MVRIICGGNADDNGHSYIKSGVPIHAGYWKDSVELIESYERSIKPIYPHLSRIGVSRPFEPKRFRNRWKFQLLPFQAQK